MILCVRDFEVCNKELLPTKRIIYIPEGRAWYIEEHYIYVERSIGSEEHCLYRHIIDGMSVFRYDFEEIYNRNNCKNAKSYEAEQSCRFAELLADGIPEYLDFSAIQDELWIKYEFVPADFFNKA